MPVLESFHENADEPSMLKVIPSLASFNGDAAELNRFYATLSSACLRDAGKVCPAMTLIWLKQRVGKRPLGLFPFKTA